MRANPDAAFTAPAIAIALSIGTDPATPYDPAKTAPALMVPVAVLDLFKSFEASFARSTTFANLLISSFNSPKTIRLGPFSILL